MEHLIFIYLLLSPGSASTARIKFRILRETPSKFKVEDTRTTGDRPTLIGKGITRWVTKDQLHRIHCHKSEANLNVSVWTTPQEEKSRREMLIKRAEMQLGLMNDEIHRMEKTLKTTVFEIAPEEHEERQVLQ